MKPMLPSISSEYISEFSEDMYLDENEGDENDDDDDGTDGGVDDIDVEDGSNDALGPPGDPHGYLITTASYNFTIYNHPNLTKPKLL